MSVKAEYIVRKLPDTFTTMETISAYEQDAAVDGEKPPKKLVTKEVESRGGWLVIFPDGRSIRLTSEDQMKTFGLSKEAKLVDLNTGLKVNAHGIPTDLEHLLAPDMSNVPKGDTEVLDGAEDDPVQKTLTALGVE